MTEQHTYCAALNCTRRGEHLNTCLLDDCGGCWPRPADHGHLCQRHYDRIDSAVQVADQLASALAEVERAVKGDSDSSSIAGPRLPLTEWKVDLDRIERAKADKTTEDAVTGERVLVRAGFHGDLESWVSTFQGALDALDFARFVHLAERRHPIVDRKTRMHRTRCGGCFQLTVINQPPDWYTGHRKLECTDPTCGWTTDDQDHAEAAAFVEALVRDPYPQAKISDEPVNREQIARLAKALR